MSFSSKVLAAAKEAAPYSSLFAEDVLTRELKARGLDFSLSHVREEALEALCKEQRKIEAEPTPGPSSRMGRVWAFC